MLLGRPLHRDRRRALRLPVLVPGGRAVLTGLRQRRADLRQRVRAKAVRVPPPGRRGHAGLRPLQRWVH